MHVATVCAKKILVVVTAFFFFGLTFLPAMQIILRLIGKPFIGAEELTRFFLICMVFLSYPLVVSNKENIVMNEFKNMLPMPLRTALDVLIDVCAIGLTLFITYATYQTVLGNMKSYTPTLEIPFWVFLACTFIAFLCSALIHMMDLVKRFGSHA